MSLLSKSCLQVTVQIKARAHVALLRSVPIAVQAGMALTCTMCLAVARATIFSRCSGAQFGGEISNGGC